MMVENFASTKNTTDWERAPIEESVIALFNNSLGINETFWQTTGSAKELEDKLISAATALYESRERGMGPEILRQLEQMVYLGSIDQLWKDHLLNMDHLKEGVGLRGYGQKDPLVEYKKEGFTLFKMMDEQVKTDVLSKLYRVEVTPATQIEEIQPKKPQAPMTFLHGGDEASAPAQVTRDEDKVGRNDLCPCGSGKKYKKCHGK